MKLLTKENRKYIYIIIICLVIMLYGVMDVMGWIPMIMNTLFNPDYVKNFFINKANPALINTKPTIINVLIDIFSGQYYFDELMAFGPRFFQIIIPLFAVIPAIQFYKYFHSVYQMRFFKEKQYQKFVFQQITYQSLKLALSIFSAYFIFLIIVQFVSDPTLNQDSIARHFLLDIFGDDLILKYKFVYYLIEGSIRFFMIPFAYSFLAQTSVLYFDNLKEIVAVPIVYYYLLTFIGYGFAVFQNNLYLYFSPAVIMSNGSFTGIHSILLILINMLPLFIGIILIVRKTKHVEV